MVEPKKVIFAGDHRQLPPIVSEKTENEEFKHSIFEHLCEYDLFVQPSINEGFGLTVAEAMAAKVPVLVSENQGPLEIIDNGKYGFSFKNGDSDDCANKIMDIIERGFDETMIEEGYKRVKTLFSIEQTASIYLQEYASIINE